MPREFQISKQLSAEYIGLSNCTGGGGKFHRGRGEIPQGEGGNFTGGGEKFHRGRGEIPQGEGRNFTGGGRNFTGGGWKFHRGRGEIPQGEGEISQGEGEISQGEGEGEGFDRQLTNYECIHRVFFNAGS